MSTNRMIAAALSALLVATLTAAVASAQDGANGSLSPEGVEWNLVTLAGASVPPEVEPTLFLSGGEVVGDAGCNSYFGSYELDATSLTFPNPFGVTRKHCEGAAQEVEDVYLPLLQATTGWAIDDEGALSLSDADGVVQLVYQETPIDVTATDVDALVATLSDLQTQIDEASVELAAVAEATADIPVNRFDRRLTAAEEDIARLDERVGNISSANLRSRITALEETVARLDRTVDRFRERIVVLEEASRDQEARIAALEKALPEPTPNQ
jgi:heat shock protein HslJ